MILVGLICILSTGIKMSEYVLENFLFIQAHSGIQCKSARKIFHYAIDQPGFKTEKFLMV